MITQSQIKYNFTLITWLNSCYKSDLLSHISFLKSLSIDTGINRGVHSLRARGAYAPPEVKQGGHMLPSNSAPPEFQIVCFCPP